MHNSPSYVDAKGVLRSASQLIAWDDRSPGSDTALKAEEVLYKQYLNSLRRYEKKQARLERKHSIRNMKAIQAATAALPVPALQRPPISYAVEALSKELPVLLKEEVSRQFYRVVRMGPACQIVVLDSRKGYLGRQQARWLRDELFASSTVWTVVLSGTPLGVEVDTVVEDEQQQNPNLPADEDSTANAVIEGGAVQSEGPIGPDKDEQTDQDEELEKEDPGSMDESDSVMQEKGSLLYAIRSLQDLFMSPSEAAKKEAARKNTPGFIDPETMSEGSGRSKAFLGTELGELAEEQFEDFDNTEEDLDDMEGVERITVDSGVIVLSGGLQQAFVATYDPAEWHSYFALEVGVGSALDQPLSVSPRPISGLNRTMLYGDVETSEDTICRTGASIQLRHDGQLVIRIYELAREGTGEVGAEDDEDDEAPTGTEGRLLYQVLCCTPDKELQAAVPDELKPGAEKEQEQEKEKKRHKK